ncbi:integrin alpha-IIb isoform X4 [Oreochromis aureus]|uniref:integrin alpha-IIb isoform X4 n=1 Tax=Oreochromis aureus TaxID=47969 RepID=UPI0019545DBB|nr:integrin alpha-IIb isoform X4 [Oreochromis aureus]
MCMFRCVCVLLCVTLSVSLNLLDEVMFRGPTGSLFGFSVDFHTINNKSFVVIGAPKANTSQSGVTEAGGVFLCPWSSRGGDCDIIDFDLTGDEVHRSSGLLFLSLKSQQWFGAAVRSVGSTHLLACAPLFHWNVQRGGVESGITPVGNCLILEHKTGNSTPFSPCRGLMMEEDYKRMHNRNDQRYCEVGFTADVTKDGRLVLGAPGSFFFQGQVITVGVDDIINSGKSDDPIKYVAGISQSDERGGYDVYHGYSVASGLLTGDSTPDYLVGVPNDRNTAGTVKIYDGRSTGSLRVHHTFLGAQVASYFGHSVAVADVNSDGLDDVLIGAPLFMDRVKEQLQERGQVVLYLQKKTFSSQPDQSLIGLSLYGRFGSALAALGDLDMDGYQDVAVGAPWSGESGQGQVFIYLGNSNGLSGTPSQVINSPLPSRTAFGFTLRSGADIDGNGYPDLLVGAWAADRAFVYRSWTVIRSRVYVSLLPDFLNPDVKLCHREKQSVSCFVIQMCVHLSGHRIPEETALEVELKLDRMKQPMARRTLLLLANQPQETMEITIKRKVGVACVNRTAYLRSEEEVRDKLSPIFITAHISLLNTTQRALLHGQTHTATQTRIILDCGADHVCVPELKLSAEPASDTVFVGGDQSVLLLVSAMNSGEGAYETELVVQIPEHTHFQSSQGVNGLVCMQRKENQTVVVTCDLGNPMRQGHKLAGNSSGVSAVSPSVQQEEPNSHRQTVHVNCSSGKAGCVRFVCDVTDLGRGFSAVIRISARLWTNTLIETHQNYELVSFATYDVINTSSKVQPLLLDSGHTQTQLRVLWRPDEKTVPIGYIILSVICGLLLLCILCFIFWKSSDPCMALICVPGASRASSSCRCEVKVSQVTPVHTMYLSKNKFCNSGLSDVSPYGSMWPNG